MDQQHSAENDAAPWRPVPGHAPTETADIFGGYLCECGASWTWTHDEQVRVIPPAETALSEGAAR